MRPLSVKDNLEHRPDVTGAQGLALMHTLKTACQSTQPLSILMFPVSAAVKDRVREEVTIIPEEICSLVKTARQIMIMQHEKRFLDKRPSDARLIQVYMSKQMLASKLLTRDHLETARALYISALRSASNTLGLGAQTLPGPVSPPTSSPTRPTHGLPPHTVHAEATHHTLCMPHTPPLMVCRLVLGKTQGDGLV